MPGGVAAQQARIAEREAGIAILEQR